MAIRILSEPAQGEMATHPASCHPLQSLCDAKGLLRGTGRLRSHISRLMRRVIRYLPPGTRKICLNPWGILPTSSTGLASIRYLRLEKRRLSFHLCSESRSESILAGLVADLLRSLVVISPVSKVGGNIP